ncbi:MAG: phenylacetic acid degradation bifunctional protein PaaZ [Melioribacteraceae bacterium]|nr:phenylacetic acid degradation bifunctional protein PaaZ [Melioribacteraceae bacterium]MCF8393280.1 phenylacetic acid degradation bifunctional protein PaaZ [Melioribacteraceae bacterium]MCF8417581.1 phenylacetic acid degradation bifunctional protein PaaZ [Melioribacteraceae bacterium]
MKLQSFINGNWIDGTGETVELMSPVTGEKIAEYSSDGYDVKSMYEYARNVGGKNLRELTFHERGRMLKSLAQHLMEKKKEFYPLSFQTGATKIDSWIDIEGGISTIFTYASKSRRELPDEKIWVEGKMEALSKHGTFVGQHVCVPLQGVALHINAYNFPIWGMLEKLGPTLIAGMPAVIKPAPVSSHLAEKMVRVIIESKILPEGSMQLILGEPGDLLDHLGNQDVVTFTGSAETGHKLKSHPNIIKNSVRFNLEADSLNCSILAPDVKPEMDEFKLFVKEVVNEMTAKAGQKCTAIRRAIVPKHLMNEVIDAMKERLAKVKIGDPNDENTRMGSLAGSRYVELVNQKIKLMKESLEVVYEGGEKFDENLAFVNPLLFKCDNPNECSVPHEVEAFGPVSTVMPYENIDEAIKLANMGQGSLVASLFTVDNEIAKQFVLGSGSYHGRIMIMNRDSAKESTGHGSPLPHLTHGGPGRAGGGEEMGGLRGILKYMQRIALQGHPTTLSYVCNQYINGAKQIIDIVHPFKKHFDELKIGETYITHRRTVTETDVVNFAGISGDFFYAHMDDVAAKESMFEKRVAHGYFVLSAAAGLFVDPSPGPVMANYGLEELRFIRPVYIGDTIQAKLTCKQKTAKETKEGMVPQGVVEWYVEVVNQNNEAVAVYSILTLVKRKNSKV